MREISGCAKAIILVGLLGLLLTGCKIGGASVPPQSVAEIVPPAAGGGDEDPDDTPDYPSALLFEHAGFEFCCGGYGTYEAHGFIATDDFLKLDGGEWAEGIEGRVGDRVFASFGNGYPEPGASSTAWVGWESTGTLTTPTFVIPARYINFLVGGGTNPYGHERATAIVLYVNGEAVRDAVGNAR